ncbi:MAG: S8 family serine peptidase [Solirubrobacteraceae bacterium]
MSAGGHPADTGLASGVDPLRLVNLQFLMHRTAGSSHVTVGMIDGPVLIHHPALASEHVREIGGVHSGTCVSRSHPACVHGTFIAGILAARRGSGAPAICPDCDICVHTIFTDRAADGQPPSASPQDLSEAIMNCIAVGASVINISAALYESGAQRERLLTHALDVAASRGVVVVVAAGNDGAIGSTALTGHPWVIPVVGAYPDGRPMVRSNYSRSIGQHGLGGPGSDVTSLGSDGGLLTSGGTSVAAPFVSGAIALLWSEFPSASGAEIKRAVSSGGRRTSVVPPLLDARRSYEAIDRRSVYV